MELSPVAELQTLLEGVPLPNERSSVLRYAIHEGATPAQMWMLQSLPERRFQTIDDIAEAILPVQPRRRHEVPHKPKEESGAPPGGDDYVEREPVSGAVHARRHVSSGHVRDLVPDVSEGDERPD